MFSISIDAGGYWCSVKETSVIMDVAGSMAREHCHIS